MEVIPSQTHKFWYVPYKIHNIHWHFYTRFPHSNKKTFKSNFQLQVPASTQENTDLQQDQLLE